MISVFLALGSNLGDREQFLRSGIRGLASKGIDIVRCASVYSTEPRDVLNQPSFLNTALEATTDLTPTELLRCCLDVERENQRVRDALKGPRTLDIDIIFYGNQIVCEPDLTIPHPSLSERRFVLAPLAEIAPGFVDPVRGKTIQQLRDECADQSYVKSVGDLGAWGP
jgi:2-amino-4-hydroxy-6-hydroxymethyldihydropteridine diphosphokinase